MSISAVDISNRALALLGSKAISSLDDNSVNAVACKLTYDPARRNLLEEYPWSFSIKRAALAADVVKPDWGKENAFTLPADFLNLAEQYPEDNDPFRDWQFEGGKIYANHDAPLYIRYISDIIDPNLFTPLFCEAFASFMAWEMAEQLTQSNPKKAEVKLKFQEAIAKARRTNAMRKIAKEFPEDDYLTFRR